MAPRQIASFARNDADQLVSNIFELDDEAREDETTDNEDERLDVESDYEFDGYFERIGEFNRTNITKRIELPDQVILQADDLTLCEAKIGEKGAYMQLMSFKQIRNSLLRSDKTFSLPKDLGEPMHDLFCLMKTMRYEPLENYTLTRVEYMKVLAYLEYESGVRVLRGDDILMQSFVDEGIEVGETLRLFEETPNLAGLYGRRVEFLRMREIVEAGLILFNMRYRPCTCPEREYLCMEGEDFYTDEMIQVYEGEEGATIDRLEKRKLCDRAAINVWLVSLVDNSKVVRIRFDVIDLADENVDWVDHVLRGVGLDAEQHNWRLMRYSMSLKKKDEADRVQLRHTYWTCEYERQMNQNDSSADENSMAIYTSICSVESYSAHANGNLTEIASLVFGRSRGTEAGRNGGNSLHHSWRARRQLRRLEPYRMQKYVQQNIVSAMFQ